MKDLRIGEKTVPSVLNERMEVRTGPVRRMSQIFVVILKNSFHQIVVARRRKGGAALVFKEN